MTAKNFDKALAKVLVHEGDYVNHPKDPGGATNKGVIQRTYDQYRKSKGLKSRSVKLITSEEVRDIYDTRYWDVVKGDKLPSGIDYVVFDGAVNSGPMQSVKWLQRALGSHYTGKIDGMVGASTIAAVEAHPNHDKLIALILARRLTFLQALKTWPTFGKGWSARIAGVKAVGQAWAMGDVGPEVEFVPDGNAKAPVEDAKAPLPAAPGDAIAGGGVVGGVVAQATEQLTPYTSIEFIGKVVAILTVVGVAAAIAGVGWRWYANRRKAALEDALDNGKPA